MTNLSHVYKKKKSNLLERKTKKEFDESKMAQLSKHIHSLSVNLKYNRARDNRAQSCFYGLLSHTDREWKKRGEDGREKGDRLQIDG